MAELSAPKKILFVLTNTCTLGDSGHLTGAYLSEITHPYDELLKSGYQIEMVSPRGGKIPLDGIRRDDPVNLTYLRDVEFIEKTEWTLRPWQVTSNDYKAIFFAGGHGAMFDFPDNIYLRKIAVEIFNNNGVIGAIGHGLAGLINLQLENGDYFVKGRDLTCFTNEEERAAGLDRDIPYFIETRLIERGARVLKAPTFSSHVVTSGRLVTAQNPASTEEFCSEFLNVLTEVQRGHFLPEQNKCGWTQASP